MVSPYAVRLLVEDRNSSGRHAGQLYFVSTFGSAAGTLLTSFYLVLILEVNQILLVLAGMRGVLILVSLPPYKPGNFITLASVAGIVLLQVL